MTDVLHLDYETASACDLRIAGIYRYAEDPSTRIWCFAWRMNEEPIELWIFGEPLPQRLIDHVARGGRVVGHNVNFERQIWNHVMRRDPRYQSAPRLEISQVCDTMARALCVHLPGGLDDLAMVLGLTERKDVEGYSLMMRMARPRKRNADGTYLWWDDADRMRRLGSYCMKDVEVECAIDKRLPLLSSDERDLWERDQRINDRGVLLDVKTIEAAVAVREVAKRRADQKMAMLTEGRVQKCTENAKIVAWLIERGLPCESINKDEHAALIAFAKVLGDEEAEAVVKLRGDASKTSTAKYEAMLAMVCGDGRARGLFAYHRAGPGRFGGMKVQPQNLPRVDDEDDLPDVMSAIKALEMFDGNGAY